MSQTSVGSAICTSEPLGTKPAYVPPTITSYTSEEILEQVGPALTCSISPCPTN